MMYAERFVQAFDVLVEARISKTRKREAFTISRTEAGNTLREIGSTLRAAYGAIAELRAILARARAREPQLETTHEEPRDSSMLPLAVKQTPFTTP